MKKLLNNRIFMLVLASDMVSNFGDVLYYLALMTYVLDLPEAKLAIALVSVSESLPILTGIVVGYWADRTVDKVQMILYTQGFRMLLYLLLGGFMGFSPSLGIAILASGMNFLSDLAGQYENGLYTPLSLRIVAEEDRETAFSFKQAVAFIFSIAFETAGALLVSVFSYRTIAWVNAATFGICLLVMLFLRPRLRVLLAEQPLKIDTGENGEGFWSDLIKSMKRAISECFALPELRVGLIIIPLINALFNVVPILLTVAMSQYKGFVFISPATTLATVSVVILVGGIAGSFLAMTAFQKVRIQQMIQWISLLIPVLFLSFYFQFLPGFFVTLFLAMLLVAGINPKLNALIVNHLPEEKLAMIGNGIGTYFHIGALLFRLAVSGLIVVLPLPGFLITFLGMGICVAVYSYVGNSFSDKTST